MSDWKKTLSLSLVVIVGMVIGMCIFTALEDDLSYADSFSLCFQIGSTIGYGNFTPKTAGGQLFSVTMALCGIPVFFWLLKQLGEHMLNGQKLVITKIEAKLFKHGEPRFLPEKCVFIAAIIACLIVVVGAVIQQRDENWKFLHGVYCFVITLTTIGFGDLIPSHPTSVAMQMFKLFYTYFGLCVMANIILGAFEVQESVEILKKKLCSRYYQRSRMMEDEHDIVRECDMRTESV
ncbi:hypothetical protein QZH41_002518 [Actinostola sp. cb2023]|nr:hypothetical protein QZH41_002518 [Actinostola sp. cb2023]